MQNDPVNFVDLWGVSVSDSAIASLQPTGELFSFLPKTSEEHIYFSVDGNAPSKISTANQDKTKKKIWVSADDVQKQGEISFSTSAGITSVTTELNNTTYLVGKSQFDFVDGSASISVTDSGLGVSASASLISVSGNIGGKIIEKGTEISASIGGSVGLNTGFEFQFDVSEGLKLDVAFLLGARVEINWRKVEK